MVQAWKDRLYRTLRWSERYTGTDMVYLASGGFWSVVGQIAAGLLSLTLAIAVARLLSKDAYGTYKFILSVVAILGTLSLNGLPTAIFQSTARGYDRALQDGFWINLRWSVLVWVGAFAFALYYWSMGNSVLAIGILLGGSLSPFLASGNLAASYLAAKRDFKHLALYFDVIENLIPAALLVATISLTQNPATIAFVYFATNTVVTLWLYHKVVRQYHTDGITDVGMFRYGKHLSIIGIISGVVSNIDQILLFHFVGPVELATYNFAIAIPDQLKGPLKNLDQMIQARFAKRSDVEIRSGMIDKVLNLLGFYGLITLCYILIAPAVFHIAFPRYSEAIPFSQLYALSIIFFALGPASSYLTIRKRVWEQYVVNLGSAGFQIAAMVIGVIGWGLLGLVVARVLTRGFNNLLAFTLYTLSR